MLIPIVCQGCGKVSGHLWEVFLEKTKANRAEMGLIGQGESSAESLAAQGLNIQTPEGRALDEMKMRRDCCRITYLSNVDMTDDIT